MVIRLFVVALLASVLAAPTAKAVPFTGSLVLQAQGYPALSIPGSGNGDPTLPSISAGAFVGSASAPVVPTVPPVTQVFLSVGGNAAGTVGNGPTFAGSFVFRGFGAGATVRAVPLGNTVMTLGFLGFPGATTMFHTAGSVTWEATFGGWGTGVATISRSHTGMTAACVPGGATCPTGMLGGATANALYFGGAAQIVLVAPIDLWSSLAPVSKPTFAVLGLNFVPEPGTLLLLGAGVVALAWRGKAMRRR